MKSEKKNYMDFSCFLLLKVKKVKKKISDFGPLNFFVSTYVKRGVLGRKERKKERKKFGGNGYWGVGTMGLGGH